MFLSIQIDLIILKTYDQQFTLTTKKTLHITFKEQLPSVSKNSSASAGMADRGTARANL